MIWQYPQLFWLLLIPLALAMLMVIGTYRRRSQLARLASHTMLQRLLPATNHLQVFGKAVLLVLGLAGFVFALARPRWGEEEQQVLQRGVDLFVLLDVSRSMLAEDVAPNRLTRAKSDIVDLLANLRGDRAGLIVFAGTPVLKIPLTNDLGFYRLVLQEVDCDSAPRGGSLIGDAIRLAMESMEQRVDRDQVVVLITDGEDHDSFPVDAAKQAAERGITILTVGLGDPRQGVRIPERQENGDFAYIQYNGQDVMSQLNEEVLKQVALATSGAYIPARTRAYDLGQIYDQYLANLKRSEMTSEIHSLQRERYQWFAGFGLCCLLLERLLSPFARRRRVVEAVGVALLLLGIASAPTAMAADTSGSDATSPATALHSGWEHFHQEDFAAAVSDWQKAHEADPDDVRISFDLACAHTALQQFDEAIELYREVSLARDWQIAADALYNLGNIYVTKAKTALGADPESAGSTERQSARNELTIAVDYYRECLRVNPNHAAARHNLETLRIWTRYIEATWRLRDRQQRLSSMTFAEILADIEKRQLQLLESIVAIEHQLSPAPVGSQRRDLVQQQDDLRTDTEYLMQKATEELADAEPEAITPLIDALQEAATFMATSHSHIEDSSWPAATDNQRKAATLLNQVDSATTSFQALVQKAIQEQSHYVDRSTKALDDAKSIAHVAPDHVAWQQQRITYWSNLLPEIAKLTQQQLADVSKPDVSKPDVSEPDNTQPDTTSNNPLRPLIDTITKSLGFGSDEQAHEQAHEQQNGESTESDQPQDPAALEAALDLAIELAPQITKLSEEATRHLANASPSSALPPQNEALELLKKIAEQLPPQQQQQQQDQNDNEDQQQQEPSQDQQDQQQQQSGSGEQDESQQDASDNSASNDSENPAESQPQNASQGDPSQENEQQQEESGSDSQKREEPTAGEGEQPPPKETPDRGEKPQDSTAAEGSDEAEQQTGGEQGAQSLSESQQTAYSREQAMAILRRARQRAAEYREKERELQRRFGRPPKSSKDW